MVRTHFYINVSISNVFSIQTHKHILINLTNHMLLDIQAVFNCSLL